MKVTPLIMDENPKMARNNVYNEQNQLQYPVFSNFLALVQSLTMKKNKTNNTNMNLLFTEQFPFAILKIILNCDQFQKRKMFNYQRMKGVMVNNY